MTSATAALPGREKPFSRASKSLLSRPEGPSLLFLVVLVVLLGLFVPGFFTADNLLNVLDQIAVIALVAVGMNMVITAADIDISVGSGIAVSAYIGVMVASGTGSGILGAGASVAAGAVLGAFNGFLVSVGRIPAIIATLATQYGLRGVLLALGASSVLLVPPALGQIGGGVSLGVHNSIWILLIVTAVAALVVRNSTWGRNVFAVGDNIRAASLAGLHTGRVRWTAFTAAGALTGLASIVLAGQTGQLQATIAVGLELQVIAAVVVGGTSILGGFGSISAALVGAVLIGVINDGMALLAIPATAQDFVLGLLILLAITTDVFRRRSRRKVN